MRPSKRRVGRTALRRKKGFQEQLPDPESVETPAEAAVTPIRDQPDRLVFRFEVGPAILDQLLKKLKRLQPVPLDAALGAPYPGFYQLFLGGKAKYIGKTSRPIGQRLREHAKKMRHRKGIESGALTCRYVFVEDPSLVDVAEGALIAFFRDRGLAEWNTTGIGSKVTGSGRGKQKVSKWSAEFAPDLSVSLTLTLGPRASLPAIFRAIKSLAPITISVPTEHRSAFNAAHTSNIDLGASTRTFEDWMRFVESHLRSSWRLNRQAESWYVEPLS